MLKKLAERLNPFKKAAPRPAVETPLPAREHAHSFSCACIVCEAETARLTLERLKRQGV